MDVNLIMILELGHESLRVSQRLRKGIRIRPCEVGSICLEVEVGEGVGEADLEIVFNVVPGE